MTQGLPAAAPRPRRRGVKPWHIALIVAVSLVGAGLITWLAIALTAPARESAHAFLGHIRAGRYDEAYAATSARYQQSVPRGDFQRRITAEMPQIAASTDATFSGTKNFGSRSCLKGTLDTPSGGARIYMKLMKESDQWRVEELGSGPVPGCNLR